MTTYAVSPRVKVSTWNHSQESVTSIPVGELVVLAEGRHPRGTTAPATAASGTATPAPAPQGQPVVIAIRDTGFKAA